MRLMSPQYDTARFTVQNNRPIEADGISFGQLFNTLWRRRWVFVSTFLGLTLTGFIILKILTPTYTSTAIIVLSAQEDSVVDLQQPYMHAAASDAVVRSEADALHSRTLVDRVIEREHLMDDPEFDIYKRPFTPNLITRLGIPDLLPKFLQNYVRDKPLDPRALTPDQLKYNVATQVLKAYYVSLDAKTYSVSVTFTSVDAQKASHLTNVFVEEYMKSQIDERMVAANNAAIWLNPRLEELKKKVEETGRAVAKFREQNHIVDLATSPAQDNTLALQEIQNLAQGLATARATRAQLEAAEQEVARLASDPSQTLSAPVVAAAPIVENVRTQEVTTQAQLASLMGTYGDRHPSVVSARNALRVLRERLAEEANRAVAQLRVQVRQAQASEADLQTRMDQLTKIRSAENRVMPRLQQLESENTGAKSVYDAFIQGLFRASSQDGVPTPKGRIIQHADTVDWPTFPNMLICMAVVLIASLMSAAALVYALEAADDSFRDAPELEEALCMPVFGMTLLATPGTSPFIRRRRAQISGRVVANPMSPISETLRLVRTAITYSRADRPTKVVMVTSALPGEGKTTFALMLARQSAQSGKRVIVVEAEMRRPTFSSDLSPLPEKGLTEYLLGDATLDEIIGVDKASGVHFIAVRDRSRMASELLSSVRMQMLLNQLGNDYDFVVLDTPPATIVADALQLGGSIDAAVLAVKWGSTPRHLVLEAAKKLRAANVPLVGAVMTQVDPKRYKLYGHGALPFEYAKAYYLAA
jgi:succinoglycan biosynthesis transport protein ExoP